MSAVRYLATTINLAVLSSAIAGGGFLAQLRAQKPVANATPPRFEVASVRLNKSPGPGGVQLSGDRFRATAPVIVLIRNAYGTNGRPLTPSQVVGGPGWIQSDVFEINAKIDESLLPWAKLSSREQRAQAMLMLQSLLADRFHLRIRHQIKELPVFALDLTKDGPKFREDTAHIDMEGIRGRGPGDLEAISAPLSSFVFMLSLQPELADRPIVDRTRLEGHYSFTVRWTPELRGVAAEQTGASSDSGPSIFTALREQLGLRLEPVKAPVDTLVIENVERPTPN